MIELSDEQAGVLKQGYPVRMFVPDVGGDVVVLLAASQESTESILQETFDEIREKAALSKLGRRAAASWMKENPTDDSSSAPDGEQHLSEADRMALANRTGIHRVLRKIANRHIAQHYPTTVAAGLEPRLEARGNADVWTLPLVYASPGFGDHGIVGDVGSITIDSRTGSVVEVTARDEVVALVRKLHEENREAIEAAFYSAAAK
jgi:hypothetical protein